MKTEKNLTANEIEKLQAYFIENKDPEDIKDEKLKEIYSKMLLDSNFTMEIMSIILKKINIQELEKILKNDLTFDKINFNKDNIEFITGNLYYVFELPGNQDMKIQMQSYIQELLNSKGN